MALPIRFCLLVCGLFVAAGAGAMTLTVQNEPHLAQARALVQEALRVGGLAVDMVDSPKANERRNVALISEGLTHIDMMPATPTRLELVRNGKLRMIPIPLDRGLLGYRVNLLLESRRDMLAGVRTAEDLRAFSLGQNVGWMDVEIYRAAGIPTKEIKDWADGEFALQMEAGFLDLFPLGLEETLTHFLPHFRGKYPQLTIDPHVIVRYPWFRFVWVSPKPEADEVFDALQRGFDKMVANGRFLRIWRQYRKPPPRGVFAGRVVIDIPNPFYGYDLVPPKYRHLLFEDGAR
ncbi:amino acid ABC transporter substrate-binding protein [Thauera butanivorans]|uniref:amino acid ABC transporter substrate-binding protein n=1 Tax=Thauera butanivorans TaxID=86174 RepID=UPI000B1C302A|nr:amino acid ABC transporter substrate-binding protein [Thauera butanivorans]